MYLTINWIWTTLFQHHLKLLKGCKVKIHLRKKRIDKTKKQLCSIICNLIAVNIAFILVNHASNLISDYLCKNQNCSHYHKLTQNNWFCDTNKYN